MSRRHKGRIYTAMLDSLDQRVLETMIRMGPSTAAQMGEALQLPPRQVAQSCRRLLIKGDAYHHATLWDRIVWAAGVAANPPQRIPRCLVTRRAWSTMQEILYRGTTTTLALAESMGASVRSASRVLIAAEKQGWVMCVARKWQSTRNVYESYWAVPGLGLGETRYSPPAIPLTRKAAIDADNDAWFFAIQAEQAARRARRAGCQDMAAAVLNQRGESRA